MATPQNNPGKLKSIAKTVSWLEKGKRSTDHGRPTRKRFSTKDVSIEMSGLAEEAATQDPYELAKNGEFTMLEALVETGAISITQTTNSNGSTLLHTAASTNQVQVMQYLIDNNAPLNAVDNEGNTPLHVATIFKAIHAIHLLLDKAASDTILNNNDDAPLHIATRMGNIDVVNAFLQHEEIDLIVPGYRKRTPLHIACEFDLVEVVDAFHNAIAVVKHWKDNASFRLCAADSDNITPIHFAARNGAAKVLRCMISKCTSHGYPVDVVLKFIDEENSTPMHHAIDSGQVNVLKVLLEFGACPIVQNGDQIPPLHLACYQGRLEMVVMMVEHCGVGVVHSATKSGQTPLHWGSRSIHSGKILQFLKSKGANPSTVDNQGQTALHYGIIFGSLEAVKELTTIQDDSIYACDNLGRNVFHHAILHRREAVIDLLLKLPDAYGLLIQQDRGGHCPLHYALQNNHEGMLLNLVFAIQDKIVNVKNENGMNYLHTSAKSGNWKALNVLLKAQASVIMVNEVDNCGSTPLHYAAIHGHIKCIEKLLSHGAMIHKCYVGFTPFLAAVRNGNSSTAKVLYDAHPFQREWTDDHGNTALHLAVESEDLCTLKLCLDLNIPITRSEDGVSFFDMLVTKGNEEMLQLVIEHDRWQECLDFPVLNGGDHSFLRLIEFCPIIAKLILDRCHQTSSLPINHPNYFEKFDFKYLRLTKEDLKEDDNEEEVDGVNSEKQEEKSMVSDMSSVMNANVNRYNRAADIGNAVIGGQGVNEQPLLALKTMLLRNRVNLLTHPVAVQYLKAKWRGYGRLVYCSITFLFFLQVILLSAFIAFTPPARLDVDDTTFELQKENVTLSEISVASNTIRVMALVVTLINSGILIMNLMSIRLRVLNITKYDAAWFQLLTHCSSIAFLIPWKYSEYGFSYIYWEAGAIASFSSWFTFFLFLKPFDLIGTYVTMFMEVLSTLIKVIFVCLLFLIAFTFPFYILVGDIRPFSTFGDSMFITFSYILGEINYEYYVTRFDRGSLQHPNLTYVFVIIAAGILAVAVANFLIGLAVGDIDTVRKNAVIRQRSGEIRIFSTMDEFLPSFFIKKYNKRFYTARVNMNVSLIRKIWRFIWRLLKDTNEQDDKDLYSIIINQQRELKQLKLAFRQQNSLQLQQYEELLHEVRNLSMSGTDHKET